MTRSKIFRSTLIAALVGVLVAIPVAPVLAQSPGRTPAPATPSPAESGQALEISPPLLTLKGDPGTTINAELKLRNIASGSILVTSQINDFTAAGEDGTPKILTDESEQDPFSMKDWVSPLPQSTIKTREIKSFPVNIRIPQTASPGGHYAVIRFTATPSELEGNGVALSASLGALVLVTVSGATTEKLEVAEFYITPKGKPEAKGWFFESAPLDLTQRIKNSGNVHEQPAGQVKITNMFGKEIASLNINMPPRNILPSSIRKFTQPLDKGVIGDKKLFGRYKAAMKLTYGESKQELTAVKTFWVIPWKLILIVVVLLVVGFFVLRTLLRRYNERIIANSRRRR